MVSPATAHLNRHGLKAALAKELQRRLDRRAAVSVFGDRWVLASRTGRREVFDDVDALIAVLSERGLLEHNAVPEHASGAELVTSLLTVPDR